MNRVLVLNLVTMLLLANCGGGKSSSKNKSIEIDNIEGLNFLELSDTVTFSSDCINKKKNGNFTVKFNVTKINENQATFSIETTATTEHCFTNLYEHNVSGEGTFFLNNRLLKVTVSAATLEPLDDAMTDSLIKSNTCELSNWQTYITQDIFHTSCFKGSPNADLYLKLINNGEDLTIYKCESNEPLSTRCEQVRLKKI